MSAVSRLIPHEVKRAARFFGHTMIDGTPEAWGEASLFWRARLSLSDRVGLAHSGLRSLPDDVAATVMAHRLPARAGSPPVPFIDVMGEAELWAASATENERAAYALAAFASLPPRRAAKFLDHVQRPAGAEVAA